MTRSRLMLSLAFSLAACDGEAGGVHVTPLRLGAPPATAALAIAGQVVDDGGAPVPDVHVRVRGGDLVRDAVTDGGGRFAIPGLREGRYDVAVLEDLAGRPSGVRHVGPASVAVVVPERYLQLVVHRVGAIAWVGRPSREDLARARRRVTWDR